LEEIKEETRFTPGFLFEWYLSPAVVGVVIINVRKMKLSLKKSMSLRA
jgi:hypothetical protein